jgi:hypothetical protein
VNDQRWIGNDRKEPRKQKTKKVNRWGNKCNLQKKRKKEKERIHFTIAQVINLTLAPLTLPRSFFSTAAFLT